jgi:hypothetical protein
LNFEKDGVDYLSDIMLEHVRVSMPSGYCFIGNDASGQVTVIAHPDKNLVKSRFTPEEEAKTKPELVSLASVFSKSKTQRNGESEYTYNGKKLIGYFNELPVFSNWILYSSIERKDIDNQLTGMINTILIIGIASIIA